MTIAQIINDAHLLIGVRSPDAGQSDFALRQFVAMMRALPGRIGAAWTDVVGEAGYYAGEDERIVCYSAMSVSIPNYFYIADGSGVPTTETFSSATMRPPKDGSRVQVVDVGDGTERLWFYRADRGWIEVSALDLTSDSPLSSEFDLYLPAMLAPWIKDTFPGSVLGEATVNLAQDGYSRLRAKLRKPIKASVDATLLRNSYQAHCVGVEEP